MRFRDVRWRDASLEQIVEPLSKGRWRGDHSCHLDPDLRANALPRLPDWRPAFGQVGAAQGHLERQGVGRGDLFLFFGWFRPVERLQNDSWRYVRNALTVHRLFGWLQVSEVVPVGADPASARVAYPWLGSHPNLNGSWRPNNTVYLATRTLNIDGTETEHAGGGMFDANSDDLVLTAPGASNCSEWRLPAWFWPLNEPPRLSYHRDRDKRQWQRRGPWVHFKTVGKGQEFVFDADGIPDASTWLGELFGN